MTEVGPLHQEHPIEPGPRCSPNGSSTHPELTVTWGKVLVRLWTHTVEGLSRNDFIIAARIDRLTWRTGMLASAAA